MKINSTIICKALVLAIAAVALFVLSPGVARADEVTIAGLTGGCFGTNGSPCSPAPPSLNPNHVATVLGLTFKGSSFQVTTSNGFVAIGNTATPPGNFNNLGSFTLSSSPNNYNGDTFNLRVLFSLPRGTSPGSGFFAADLIGTVTSINQGGVQITFSNPTQTFLFNGGTFSLTVNNLGITGGQGPVALTGFFTAHTKPVPEPATLLLMGTGLAGVAAGLRKRGRRKEK